MLIQSAEIRFVVFVVLILTELEADDALMAENTVSLQTRSIDHVTVTITITHNFGY